MELANNCGLDDVEMEKPFRTLNDLIRIFSDPFLSTLMESNLW